MIVGLCFTTCCLITFLTLWLQSCKSGDHLAPGGPGCGPGPGPQTKNASLKYRWNPIPPESLSGQQGLAASALQRGVRVPQLALRLRPSYHTGLKESYSQLHHRTGPEICSVLPRPVLHLSSRAAALQDGRGLPEGPEIRDGFLQSALLGESDSSTFHLCSYSVQMALLEGEY